MTLFEEVPGYYRMQDSLCVSSDVNGLTEELRIQDLSKQQNVCIRRILLSSVAYPAVQSFFQIIQ